MRNLILAALFACLLASPSAYAGDEAPPSGPSISGGGGNSSDPRDTDDAVCTVVEGNIQQEALEHEGTSQAAKPRVSCPDAKGI